MRRVNIISLLTAFAIILAAFVGNYYFRSQDNETIKIGFIYVGDGANQYTNNFIRAQEAIEENFGSAVECHARYNITEGIESIYIEELLDEGCDMIIGTSYGYKYAMKDYAEKNPNVLFIQATGDNINEGETLDNYYTFMGHIYEGRYITGVIAGLKINEMIEEGVITSDEAVIGYVAAYPYAEVISGYTAFLLGARSVCPSAVMKVRYTNTWSSYTIEKIMAEQFIDEGCVIIAQHSDTKGPAVACEENTGNRTVYHISYNQTMRSIAPTTSLTGCRINWNIFELKAVEAVLNNKRIEDNMDSSVTINGKDMGAGINEGWVEMLDLNEAIAPTGAEDAVKTCLKQFASGKLEVFKGPYTGVDPFDPEDVIDLSQGYQENENSSAPSFHYVLNDIIEVLD